MTGDRWGFGRVACSSTENTQVSDASQGSTQRFVIEALPTRRAFRPPRNTAKPRTQGLQTAWVVGPPGEEIHCDKFGRVKVQFHWDRIGKMDDKSSCYIRVASSWAGSNFGAIAIPRIGMEVLVDHIDVSARQTHLDPRSSTPTCASA